MRKSRTLSEEASGPGGTVTARNDEGRGDVKRRTGHKKAPKELGEAIEEAEIIRDFLPGPDQPVLKEETVRVTLNLSKDSVAFFKEKAKENRVSYQNMIKAILDLYAERFQEKESSRQSPRV
jgi:predicted DNA binding CopG/RHH family protein